MPLSDVLKNFGMQDRTVTRRASAGYDAQGRKLPPVESTLSVPTHVQPVGGRELDRLPEGLRARELRAVWSTVPLKPGGEAGAEPDHITIDGEIWEVQLAENWSQPPWGGFVRHIVARLQT